jgi:hypothetical protein
MDPITFAIVGLGWRAAAYERVAAALPDCRPVRAGGHLWAGG